MALFTDVVTGVRAKLRDFPKMFQTDILGDGIAQIFEFPVVVVEPTTLIVQSINPFPATPVIKALVSGVDYTLDAWNGMLMLTAGPLTQGWTLNVQGTHYQWFLDSMIITEAQWWTQVLDDSQQDNYYFANLTTTDPRFELTVRGVLVGCLWSLLIEASLDIDVRNPEGVDIPTSQRFAQLNQLVQVWEQRYHDLSDRLNIGIDRIEMTSLRRMSLSTGKLVPLYKEMEFDDQATPQRLYPLIDADQALYDPPPPPTIPPPPGPFSMF